MSVTVFLCGPEPEDIFTAVYDAWASRLGHDNVRLEIDSEQRQMGLFCQYVSVARDLDKAEKVSRSIARKISSEAYYGVYRAALSFEPDRADAIYRFLIVGFVQWSNGVLFARLAPKCNVLPLVAPHFDDRMSGEHWVIYDEIRHKAAVHPAGGSWFMVDTVDVGWEEWLQSMNDGQQWEDLWRTFVDHIAIEPRRNPGLQRNLMPLWYRKNMTEHQLRTGKNMNVSKGTGGVIEEVSSGIEDRKS